MESLVSIEILQRGERTPLHNCLAAILADGNLSNYNAEVDGESILPKYVRINRGFSG